MPLSHGRHDARVLPSCLDEMAAGLMALVVVEDPKGLAAEHGHALRRMEMTVDGQHRARLQGVEHALALVVLAVAQVEVLPQARVGLGLGGEGVEEGLGDYHINKSVFKFKDASLCDQQGFYRLGYVIYPRENKFSYLYDNYYHQTQDSPYTA